MVRVVVVLSSAALLLLASGRAHAESCGVSDDCVAGAICGEAASPPGFTCACPGGTSGDGRASGSGCANVDECASHPCAASGDHDDNNGQDGQGCLEIPLSSSWQAPGYICSCAPGYAQGGSPRSCVVASECTNGTDDCDRSPAAVCNDPNPSPASLNDFTCTCPGPAWENHPTLQGHTAGGCVDVDECVRGLADCGEHTVCVNLLGAFRCDCEAGYTPVAGTTGCAEVCGDGVVGPNEGCDDGEARSDTAPDACRTSCESAACGDGVIDTGELCDPGGGVPAVDGACTTACDTGSGDDDGDADVADGDGGDDADAAE
ncbi:MAG: hypothetical protein KC635_27915, partial [Myxococcales bacterium]|nr:hypothetical protein [Myxococcales bacterium]